VQFQSHHQFHCAPPALAAILPRPLSPCENLDHHSGL
jgi:hypothetical protein